MIASLAVNFAVNTFVLDNAGPQPEPRSESAQAPVGLREPASVAAVATEQSLAIEAPSRDHAWQVAPRKRGVWIAILALHGGLAWALSHSLMQPAQPAKPAPVEVRLVEPAQPKPQPPLPRIEIQAPVVAPVPFVQPPNVNLSQIVTVAEAPPVPMPAKPAPVAAPLVPAPVASTGPKEIAASALRYVVGPHGHVPRMSRKLGESGTVVLRIVVGADGLLKSATLKKSSGFERLDQQALLDIRTARFEPYVERGQPIDVQTDAGIQYELR